MTAAPSNVFQRLARTWDAVHPYNAAQACRVAGLFAQADASVAWASVMRDLGVDLTEEAFRADCLSDDADLSQHFTRELNRPFMQASPFRPFIQRAGNSTWFGVVYRHAAADSVSIRGVIHAWLARLGAIAPGQRPARPRPCRSRDVLSNWRGAWRLDETILRLLRRYGENRRVRKIHTFGPLEYPVRVRLQSAPPCIVPGLIAYARARRVTVNDVCLAALAHTCHRLVPAQQRPGRDDLAISSVADLRPGLGASVGDSFGCLLGLTTTVCRRRDLNDWDRLLRSVAAQSAAQRRAGVGPASVAWMLAAEFASRFTPPGRVYDFYRKEIPLAAGISNVNLNGTWAADARVLDYVRVSPTGPIVPVALAVTSLGDEMRLALTYRTALLNDWTASELAGCFTDVLRCACGGG